MTESPRRIASKGDLIELDITGAAFEGKAIGRIATPEGGELVVFVMGSDSAHTPVPGDRVRARVTKRKGSYAESRAVEIVTRSPLRTAPRCEYFGPCGGCRWQHVAYAAQLEFKRGHVIDALERIGGFRGIGEQVRPALGSPEAYFYRNKMEFTFARQRWLTAVELNDPTVTRGTSVAVGLHPAGQFGKVLDLHACYLESPESVALLNATRAWATAGGHEAYSTYDHTGFLRHLVIREGKRTGERLLNLITTRHDADAMAGWVEAVQSTGIPVTTMVNTINRGKAMVATGESVVTLTGAGTMTEGLETGAGLIRFQLSPNAFFQTNTHGAERLYGAVRDLADLKPTDRLYDLYCGAGSIALFLANQVMEVVGVEIVEAAVEDATMNAKLNGITNATFHLGDLKDRMTEEVAWIEQHGRPDVIVLDPPRAGLHPAVAERVPMLGAERIVYVSCNPTTQARDLQILTAGGYRIDAVQPMDMFPHTYHIENIVRLTRIGD